MTEPSVRIERPDHDDRWLDYAGWVAGLGLVSLLVYLLLGFGPWTMAVGFFVGVPLLSLALILYAAAVLRDLRRKRVL